MIDNSEDFVNDDSTSGGEYTPEMEDQIRQIEALASMDASFANSQEYKDLMAAKEQMSSQSSETDEDEEDEDEDEEYDEDVDDVFGVTKEAKVEKEVQLTFEPTKEMQKFIESKYGVKDVAKFFSSADTWRNQAQEVSDTKRELELLTSDLQAMPPEIRQAVNLWANGDDYTKAFNQNERLDFSSDFSRLLINDGADLQWILKHDATAKPNCRIDDSKIMHANDVIKQHLNQFKGWSCNAGLESLMINWDGEVHRATCRVGGTLGNIYANSFVVPTSPVICDRNYCTCAADIPLTKTDSAVSGTSS